LGLERGEVLFEGGALRHPLLGLLQALRQALAPHPFGLRPRGREIPVGPGGIALGLHRIPLPGARLGVGKKALNGRWCRDAGEWT
jgi:hypothetical protein